MSVESANGPIGSRIAALLHTLTPKAKQPVSATVLKNWIAQAEGKLGPEAKGGRLGWLIASSVAIAAVQRAIDADGRQLFLLKGGTLLQHRLNATARPTKDVDGLIRGDLDAFLLTLEDALVEPWGPLTLRRGEVEVVNVPTKLIKPRRFDIIIEMRGVTWRRIQFEVSPDEAGIGSDFEAIEPPPLSGFGLPDPDSLIGIAMRFQIAQKFHAVSDPHDPPPPSMTVLATWSTCSFCVISQRRRPARPFPRFEMRARRCLRPAPTKPNNSATRTGRGRRL